MFEGHSAFCSRSSETSLFVGARKDSEGARHYLGHRPRSPRRTISLRLLWVSLVQTTAACWSQIFFSKLLTCSGVELGQAASLVIAPANSPVLPQGVAVSAPPDAPSRSLAHITPASRRPTRQGDCEAVTCMTICRLPARPPCTASRLLPSCRSLSRTHRHLQRWRERLQARQGQLEGKTMANRRAQDNVREKGFVQSQRRIG